MKILCTGDVHIGRRSSRLPAGGDSRTHSCAAAWLRIVDTAIAEAVDLVTVSGDLVDQANRFFEAFGPVEAGLRRLREAGIETFLVAGNHDFEVLPRIVDAVGSAGVHLLGRRGEWERRTVERGGLRLHVDGWSFTREGQPTSPLATYAPPDDGVPTLTLLHGDLDQPRSPYAPISLAELRRHSDALFLLGHVHATRSWNEAGGARALYPGSPQAMDPAETGAHGVHLVTASARGFEARHLPLSTVRYDALDIAADDFTTLEEVDEAVVSGIREAMAEAAREPHLRRVVYRVRLTGRTALHRHLADRLQERVAELEVESGRAVATVEAVTVDTRPARDLVALAAAGGAPAILATLIAELEGAGPGVDALVHEARLGVREIARSPAYLPVRERMGGPGEDEAALRVELGRAAMQLLDEMLAGKETGE